MNSGGSNEHLLMGYECYRSHQYAKSLKYYTLAYKQSNSSWVKSTIQLSIAIINIHLCNYNQAYSILLELEKSIKPTTFQSVLILIKTHTSLALINLINTQTQTVYRHIQSCLQLINIHPDYSGFLFQIILEMLYGFNSFTDMSHIANSLANQEGYCKNGVMCSAMAINREICGNSLQLSYRLQHKAYQMFKMEKQTVMMALSCRHLLHLSKQLKLSKNIIELYQKQLHTLMNNTQQIKGISQITLFGKYQEKINCASQVTKMLYYYQNQILKTKKQNSNNNNLENYTDPTIWKKNALLNKIKRLKKNNTENCDILNRTITMLSDCKDSAIQIMEKLGNTQFIQIATKQYQKAVIGIVKILEKDILRQAWGSMTSNYLNNHKKQPKKIENATVLRKTQRSPIKTPRTNNYISLTEVNITERNQIEKNKEDIQKSILNKYKSINNDPIYQEENSYRDSNRSIIQQFMQDDKISKEKQEENIFAISKNHQSRKFQEVLDRQPRQEAFTLTESQTLKMDKGQRFQDKSKIKTSQNPKSTPPRPPKKTQEKMELSKGQGKQAKSTIQNQKMQEGNKSMKQTKSKILSRMTNREDLIKKCVKLCYYGQYAMKRHFSSDGGQQKFVKLTKTHLKWAPDQQKIDSKFQSYLLKDIKGIVFGKVTDTFLKQCNQNLQPWKCFSLILQKRTLDFYCTQQHDLQFWLPGISQALTESNTLTKKVFSPGRVLWKRALMKLTLYYLHDQKKKHRKFYNANAYAIIQFGRDNMQINLSKLKKNQS